MFYFLSSCFFFNDTATTEIYTLSLHDALPISQKDLIEVRKAAERAASLTRQLLAFSRQQVLEPVVLELNELVTDFEKMRSEEHTSELQSRLHLVCRLLLEKKKTTTFRIRGLPD